jgi:hypothetical protein
VRTRILGILSITCLILTILWLVFLIADMASAGPMETFEQVLAHVSKLNALFYLTYSNAALITVSAVMLFAALYIHYKSSAPEWSAIAVAFVPIYGVLNLIAYLSQITIVPHLLELLSQPEYQVPARFMLQQSIQTWPDSAIAILNGLAYAVLGIPSVIFGVLMTKSDPALRVGGVLLALNGIACIAGFIGVQQGTLIGGVLFLLALVPMSWVFLKQSKTSVKG